VRARAAQAAVALALLAFAGCGSGPEPRLGEGEDEPPGGGPAPGQSADEQVIRDWNTAVNLGDFERAADLFERGAVVEQVGEIELATRADAIAFNRSLPCRAEVTDLKSAGDSTIAAFSLREGRAGGCAEGGSARVRFVIEDGRITEWRQLTPPAAPPGETAGVPWRLL